MYSDLLLFEILNSNSFNNLFLPLLQKNGSSFVLNGFLVSQYFLDPFQYLYRLILLKIDSEFNNHEIVKKKAQISAVSGRIIEQKVKFIGKEDVKIGNKTYKTLRFNFSSSDESLSKDKKLNTDIWYEENTFLWVKAAFDKTGYWEYRIKTF